MAVLVLLHWFLLLEGQGLPCYVTYWASSFCEYLWYIHHWKEAHARQKLHDCAVSQLSVMPDGRRIIEIWCMLPPEPN